MSPSAIVTIAPYHLWGEGPGPEGGDYLLESGGAAYLICDASETRRRGRYRLACLPVQPADVPAEATVFSLRWRMG